MPHPVKVAAAAHARAVRFNEGPARVLETKLAINEARVAFAIQEAIDAAPPLTAEARERLAALLIGGGK